MNPNEDRVVLKPIPPETQTKSGLLIPEQARKIEKWEIVSIGPSSQVCKTCGTKRESDITPGMVVLINADTGLDYTDEGEAFRIVRFSDIHGYDHKK